MIHFKICVLSLLVSSSVSAIEDQGPANDTLKSRLPQDCGRTRFDIVQKRVVGGDVADIGQFPWIVRLGKTGQGKKSAFFFCAGSLINRYYVISAAHCEDIANIVRLGENDLEEKEDSDDSCVCAPPHQDIPIKKYVSHNYESLTDRNDIMLIELQRAAKFNDFVQPVCLPGGVLSEKFLNRKLATVAGWGSIHPKKAKDPKSLMYFMGPILGNSKCKGLFDFDIVDSQLCIGYDKGKDSCDGDSGGPATITVKQDEESRAFLVGIVSYGFDICGTGPAVYTNVPYYLNWLSNLIKKS